MTACIVLLTSIFCWLKQHCVDLTSLWASFRDNNVFSCQVYLETLNTVDGRDPAPPGMYNTL